MEDHLKKMEDHLKKIKNGTRPPKKMDDDLDTRRQPNFYLNGRWSKQNAILTNSTAQHRQPDQHNNQKYIGTIKKINLIGCDIIVN